MLKLEFLLSIEIYLESISMSDSINNTIWKLRTLYFVFETCWTESHEPIQISSLYFEIIVKLRF